ncbi:hypothetical protein vfu_B01420 [Vibrio furnissii NCTC 11218]|nr:hypothetical protein vfu_B01420 [Vibrio furnissii NCTC 11218]
MPAIVRLSRDPSVGFTHAGGLIHGAVRSFKRLGQSSLGMTNLP